MKRLAKRKSTIAFLLCLPLMLLIVGFVIYRRSTVVAQYVEQEDDRLRRSRQFRLPAETSHVQLVIFQSCLFAVTPW